MNSRELVHAVFEGKEPPRIPFLFEGEQKTLEHELGDAVVIHAWVPRWGSFLSKGGPFRRREGQDLWEWAEGLDVDEYDWPDVDEVVEETMTKVKEMERFTNDRFVIFEVLGPTEQSEFFCMPPSPIAYPERATYPALSRHHFDFSVLTKLEPRKGRKLYDRCGAYILELVKAGAELNYVDAVRIADDACSHAGPNYSAWFMRRDYLRWHGKLAGEVRKRGKFTKLHADGNLLVRNLLVELARCYDSLHPLDFAPKATVGDSLKWVDLIVKARKAVSEMVFFTGIPIELMFRDDVGPREVARVAKKLLRRHGSKRLVLTDTHRPFPGRSFGEAGAMAKVKAVLEVAKAHAHG